MSVSNATLLAKISALEARVTALAAKVKSDETSNGTKFSGYDSKFTTLNPLVVGGSSQNTFLANINSMTTPGSPSGASAGYPLSTDGTSGSTWAAGERDYVNSSINEHNLLIQKLQRANLMT